MRWSAPRCTAPVVVLLWLIAQFFAPASASAFDRSAAWSSEWPDDAVIEKYDVTIHLGKDSLGFAQMKVVEVVTLRWGPGSPGTFDFRFVGRDDRGADYALFDHTTRIVAGDSVVQWPAQFCGRGGCSGTEYMTIRAPSERELNRRVVYEDSYTLVGNVDVVGKEWVMWNFPEGEINNLIEGSIVKWYFDPAIKDLRATDPCSYPVECSVAADQSWLRITQTSDYLSPGMSTTRFRLGFAPGTFNTDYANWWGNQWLIWFWVFAGGGLLLLGGRVGWRIIAERFIPWWKTHPTQEIPSISVGSLGLLLGRKTRTGYAVLIDLAIRGKATLHFRGAAGARQFEVQFAHTSELGDDIDARLIALFAQSHPKPTMRYALWSAYSEVIDVGVTRVERFFADHNDALRLTALKRTRTLLHVINFVLIAMALVCLVLGWGLFELALFGVTGLVMAMGFLSWISIQRGPAASRSGIAAINHAGDLETFLELPHSMQDTMLGSSADSYQTWEKYLAWWILLGTSSNWVSRLAKLHNLDNWPAWIKSDRSFSLDEFESVVMELNGMIHQYTAGPREYEVPVSNDFSSFPTLKP